MAGDGFERNIIWHDENHFSYVTFREKILHLMKSCAEDGRQKWMGSGTIIRLFQESEIRGYELHCFNFQRFIGMLIRSGHVERTRRIKQNKFGNPKQYLFRCTDKPYKRMVYDVRIFEDRKILTGFRRKNIKRDHPGFPRWFVSMMIY